MGISRQSLYDTYGNKRELFEAALKKYRDEVIEPKLEELSDATRSATELIRQHLKSIADGSDQMPIGCLVVRTATEIPVEDSEIGQLLDDCVKKARHAIHRVIERGQQSGEFDSGRSARDMASLVIASGMGLHVLRRLPNRGRDVRPSIDSILTGLKASVTEH
jgi:TetR/AcrR family transcriptional repressor of nem operon